MAVSESRVRSKRWTYTVHNIGQWLPHYDPMEVAYMCAQVERGKDTGHVHWQGYVRFNKLKTMKCAKSYLGRQDAHLETAEGTEEQNHTYCTKDDTHVEGTARIEYGTYDPNAGKKIQGHRSDLEAVYNMVSEGHTFSEIARAHPVQAIKFHAGIREVMRSIEIDDTPIERPVYVTVLWGGSGVGKTHRATHADPRAFHIVGRGRDAFGGYSKQTTVVFDEFNPNYWPIEEFNVITDKWVKRMDARYHNVLSLWNHVIICSNYDPDSWYKHHTKRETFLRRISPPYGRIYNLLSREQEVDMNWYAVPIAPVPQVDNVHQDVDP